MNVVGKFGNLITQGVYSVATPFHPFGGAVDVIVVQQQDGSFRSTPWYVRFGKFQGVLKGSEKVVQIAVNGIDASFHMYLDNSGEAYFVKEVDHSKGGEANGVPEDSDNPEFCSVNGDLQQNENEYLGNVRRLEHSVSDSGVDQLQGEDDSLEEGLERAESDGGRRFYEFQDDQSSLDDSVELSEYGSNRYDSMEGENVVESQNLDSEVVLVSVDGHILTAPITAAEQNSEKMQLSTPQFHLGPVEEVEFCADNNEFSSGESTWAVDYVSKLNGSNVANGVNDKISGGNDGSASGHRLEVCEGEEEHSCQASESRDIAVMEGDTQVPSDSEDILEVKKEEGCKSSSEASKLSTEVKDTDLNSLSSSLGVQSSTETHHNVSGEEGTKDTDEVSGNDDGLSPSSGSVSLNNGISADVQCNDDEPAEENGDVAEASGFDNCDGNSPIVITENSERKEDEKFEFDVSSSVVGMGSTSERPTVTSVKIDNTLERPTAEDEGVISELTEAPTTTYDEASQTHSNTGFEISLCGNKLQPGMGSEAAAEAFDANRVSAEEFKSSASSILKNGNLIIRYRGHYLPWEKAAHIALGIAAFGSDLPIETKDAIPVEQVNTKNSKNDDSGLVSTPSGRRWRLWSIPFRRVKTLEHSNSALSNDEEFVDSESVLPNSQVDTPTSQSHNESPRKQLVRTNVPSSEQIASLNLKDGQNIVTFSFPTRVLGRQQVEAHMYLWKWNARIVISDVDGTITKSDVLGQFMPLVGKDWTQSGVAKLFSAIKANGYQLLFLSARAIVQAYLTRSFLLNLRQDGNTLPDGPVVISPDGLFPSLYREVIRRAPHEFKIACLEDIKKLFPPDYNPFYAGFGNRDTDELSYRKIGIPKGKIFIINPKGEVAISHRIDVKSYTSLHTLVNDMFPPTSLVEQEDFNSWNFWKVPLPEVEE